MLAWCQSLICTVFVLSYGYCLAVYIIYLLLKMSGELTRVENLTENFGSDDFNSGNNGSHVLDTDEGLAALDLFAEYPSALLTFAAVFCIILMIIGIPGNLITIFSLARYKKVRNATAIFIINMSLADLLYCCINLPLAISTFLTRKWLHGVFMCKFFVFTRFSLSGVAVLTVFAITINRYIMISYPSLYTKLYTSRNLGIQVAITWIISIAILIPTWVEVWGQFGMDLQLSYCVVLKDVNGESPMKPLFICSFVIPFIAICFCYGRIFCIVRKTTIKSHGTVRRVKVEKDDSSFATSPSHGEVVTPQQQADPPKHPRVQSLRPPSTTHLKVSIAADELSSESSISNFNFARSINLRKSQLLNLAPTSKDKRLLTMITAIMTTFFVLHLPITIIMVFNVITEYNPWSIIWSYLLRYLTSCINPIIYVAMSHEYRKAYRKLMVLPSCNKSCLPR